MVAKGNVLRRNQRGRRFNGWGCRRRIFCGSGLPYGQDCLRRPHRFDCAEACGGQRAVLAEHGFEDEYPDGVLHTRQCPVRDARRKQNNQENPDRDTQDIEEREQPLAFRAFFILFLLKILCCAVKLSLRSCECTRRRELRTSVETVEQDTAIDGTLHAQIAAVEQMGQGEMEEIEKDNEQYAK